MTGAVLGVDCTEIVYRYQEARRANIEASNAEDVAWEQEVDTAMTAVRAAHKDAVAAAQTPEEVTAEFEAYVAASNAAWAAHRAPRDAARATRRASGALAWDAYVGDLRSLGDPVVTWVADNTAPYHHGRFGEAAAILLLLPCTLADIDDHAAANRWRVWTELRDRAITDLGIEDTP